MSYSFDHESENAAGFSGDRIQEMLTLAARLREREGGELDDLAIAAVAEATGASTEYVRLVVRTLPQEKKKQSLFERWRASYLGFDPKNRRYIMAVGLAVLSAFCSILHFAMRDGSGLFSLMATVGFLAGLWNLAKTRSKQHGVITGAIHAGAYCFALALFSFIYRAMVPLLIFAKIPLGSFVQVPPMVMIGALAAGSTLGLLIQTMVEANRDRLGLTDPTQERHRLLQQLLDITDKLKSDEQIVTFLSVDIVGSTKMKADADLLAIEFTFNEYHQYVEQVVLRNAGQIHSTAGDGVTAVFENPGAAVNAAKALLAGLFEFNAFRNRVGQDIILRAGVHTGTVLAPGRELTSVNFAHVIDVCAHMQKVAPEGGLVVSGETAIHMEGGMDAIGEERVEVQGIPGVIWRPSKRSIPIASLVR